MWIQYCPFLTTFLPQHGQFLPWRWTKTGIVWTIYPTDLVLIFIECPIKAEFTLSYVCLINFVQKYRSNIFEFILTLQMYWLKKYNFNSMECFSGVNQAMTSLKHPMLIQEYLQDHQSSSEYHTLIEILWSNLTLEQNSSWIWLSVGTPMLVLSTLVYSELALEYRQEVKSKNYFAQVSNSTTKFLSVW